MGLFNKIFKHNKCYDAEILARHHRETQNRLEKMRNQLRLYNIHGTGVQMTEIEHDVFEYNQRLNALHDMRANIGGAFFGWLTNTPEGAAFGRGAFDIATGLGDRSGPMSGGLENVRANFETKMGSHLTNGGIKGFNEQLPSHDFFDRFRGGRISGGSINKPLYRR